MSVLITTKRHVEDCYVGLHYDLHAGESDTTLGDHTAPEELIPKLAIMNPDFVQTDCKGHPGYASWFSETPEASVPPGLKHDALRGWREATEALGMPLHCHYSGIWDIAAGARHPEWAVTPAPLDVESDPSKGGQNTATPESIHQKMCPRSDYLDKLMIPQLLELIDRYGVDGFWIDGDLWSVEPCYCATCIAAWHAEGNTEKPPADPKQPDWPLWFDFTKRSFLAYVTRYTEAVHAHRPDVRVCSNWLQTFRDPGAPSRVPTDWISGDNSATWGLDGSRVEARFLSTRGKPWDIMLWGFYFNRWADPTAPHTAKPTQMLLQEAAALAIFGGNVQFYEHPQPLRDGRLGPWRMRRFGEAAAFLRKRQALCRGGETVPQVAVLHSEHHLQSTAFGRNLMNDLDVKPVQGAVFALLENHVHVDVLDEWALLPRLPEFPVVVVPEQHNMSRQMAAGLKAYCEGGGRLLVTGAKSIETFGAEFFGVEEGDPVPSALYYVPVGQGDDAECAPLFSEPWRLTVPTDAIPILGVLGNTPLLDDELTNSPTATLRKIGGHGGAVAYLGADLFRDFERNRYPATRCFTGKILSTLAADVLDFTAPGAPACIDLAVRRKDDKLIIHLLNRLSGIPNQPNNGAIDEIPELGPIRVLARLKAAPTNVSLAFENANHVIETHWDRDSHVQEILVSGVHIHAAIVIEEGDSINTPRSNWEYSSHPVGWASLPDVLSEALPVSARQLAVKDNI